MRSLSILLALLAVASVLPGCPFSSKVPLATPAPQPIPSELVGHWIWEDPDGEETPVLLSVLPFNDAETLVVLEEQGKAASQFRAFPFRIGDEEFWHVNGIGPEHPPTSYIFARVALTDAGDLALEFVGDAIVPKTLATDAEGLRAFLAEHLSDPALADDDEGLYLWRRPREGEVEKGMLKGSPSAR